MTGQTAQQGSGIHHYIITCTAGLIIMIMCLSMGGCTKLVAWHFRNTVDKTQGTLILPGLKEPVTVRRDAFGIPFVEAKGLEDMAMAIGYVHAEDRLTQMVGLKLMSEGRLAEMAGPSVIDLDIYFRILNLKRLAETMLKNLSSRHRILLERYSSGVNAYVDQHRGRLAPGLALSRYSPDKWEPIDSLMIFQLMNLALSFNLFEETAALSVAHAIGADKTVWLLPIYPDEPIPFEEAAKFKDVNLEQAVHALSKIEDIQRFTAALGFSGIAASNNWAISEHRTLNGASILCNDTHLPLSLPSLWNMMHIRCGDLDVAGVGFAGIPLIAAGYNGHIAWGMTMVMADNQDIFLERLRIIDGRLHYLFKGQWLPTSDHQESIKVMGKAPVTITVHETRHGPILNDAMKNDPIQLFQPQPVDLPYGIALSWAATGEDRESADAIFDMSFAKSVDEAIPLVKHLNTMALNIVFADKNNIAWQVTGTYPLRVKGRGLMPSPGWTGEYDWMGILDPMNLPRSKNPPAGFIGTANNRTVPKDYPHILSSSWYWPERAERIDQMVSATSRHTVKTCKDMQLDTHSLFVPKLKDTLLTGKFAGEIIQEIKGWKDEGRREKAQLALTMIKDFDGNMRTDSKGAALVGALLHCATKNIFLDELGPEGSRAWSAFLVINNESYNATCDHILIRGDESPFWDDVKTSGKETKVQTLALSLADTVTILESSMGRDPNEWRWGILHTSVWETEASKMADRMGAVERVAMKTLWSYFNRGPYPAPGDVFTLNVSQYTMGENFDTWLIPEMRMIVDFSKDEPMLGVNSSGQSDNPSSPHYDDGINAWRRGEYIRFPFKEEAVKAQYREVLVLTP